MFAKFLAGQIAVLTTAQVLNASGPIHPPAAVAYIRALASGVADPLAAAWANVNADGLAAPMPGAYVHYDIAPGTSKAVRVEHTWHRLPAAGSVDGNSVFMSMMIAMEAGQGGYFGTQVFDHKGSETTQLIFSLWDCSPSQPTKTWSNYCTHYVEGPGGEGSFSQCKVALPIQQDVPMVQEVRFAHDDGQHQWWEWWVNGNSYGQIGLPNCKNHRGYGDIVVGGNGGFMEYPYWGPKYGDCNAVTCNVGWHGPLYGDGSVKPHQAHPQYNTACPTRCVRGSDQTYGSGSSQNPIVNIQGGAGTTCDTQTGQNLWRGVLSMQNATYLI